MELIIHIHCGEEYIDRVNGMVCDFGTYVTQISPGVLELRTVRGAPTPAEAGKFLMSFYEAGFEETITVTP